MLVEGKYCLSDLPRSFADSNGDGIGDLRITQRLEYLSTLGVNLLWINPFYASPNVDNGYDVSDYEDIHPDFGNMADVEELIAQAHARNMRIMLDVVINHTSDQHAWVVESRKSRDNPYRDFYIWRDGKDGREPNTGWLTSAVSVDLRRPDRPILPAHLLSTTARSQLAEPTNPRCALQDDRMVAGQGHDGLRLDAISFIAKALASSTTTAHSPTSSNAGMMHGPEYHAYLQ
ncbi:MAG: alpha-amylase family glycosyl hydrolase [Caldilineaceae bacterium]